MRAKKDVLQVKIPLKQTHTNTKRAHENIIREMLKMFETDKSGSRHS